MKTIQQITGIEFKDESLLNHAFVHRSYLNEHKDDTMISSNEKLEFLGDSVLSLATSIYLYKFYPLLDEGTYTDIKASVVRTETLAEVAKSLHFGEFILLSKGEELNGGRDNKNIFEGRLSHIVENKLYLSPKSRLQELIQASHKTLPQYILESESGPEHKKTFEVSVLLEGKPLGKGVGFSKKEAEENAAKNALEFIRK